MNRSQFRERNSRFNIPEKELERMYKVYQEEILMEQILTEAVRIGAIATPCDEAGGAGGNPADEDPV